MRKLYVALMIAALSVLAHGQTAPITGNITTASAGPGNCVSIRAQNNSAVGIIVSGTWSGTLTPNIQISTASGAPTIAKKVLPVDSSTAQATITANGGYLANVGGFTQFNLCATAFSSGTAIVSLYSTPAPNNSTIASGGAGGGVSTFSGDGTLITNSGSTGAVTVSIGNAGADTVWGNATGSSAAPGYTNAPVVSSISAIGANGVSAGVVGTAGVVKLVGSTSGSASITAPAVAGTTSNPLVISNDITVPSNSTGCAVCMAGQSTGFGLNTGNVYTLANTTIVTQATATGFFTQEPICDYATDNNCLIWGSGIISTGGSGNPLIYATSNICRISTAVTLTTTTTICSWTLPASAKTWSYRCDGMYQTTTSAITLLLGTQFAQAPTNSTHSGVIWSAASTQTYAQVTNTGTTATTTVTGVAPSSGTATPWEAHGTFTGSATSGTFVIYGTASTSSDAQINGGSSCELL